MVNALIIRDALEKDLAAIVDIYNAAIPTRQATADLEFISVESRLQWFWEHSPTQYPIWVAQSDNTIIGWLSLQKFYGRPAYAKTAEVSLYISPDYRRQGIGKKLVQHMINSIPYLGLTALICLIFAHNEPSIYLFEKFGFQRWGFLPQVAELDEMKGDVVILGKQFS